jgi:PPM family protein phosphatase
MTDHTELPAHSFHTTLDVAALSDRGLVRQHNEDRCAIIQPPASLQEHKGVMFLVADGLGGHNAGEVASEMVVTMFPSAYYSHPNADPTLSLQGSIEHVNWAIHKEARCSPHTAGMGSTVAAAVITSQFLIAVNVGDSRVYLAREGKLRRLTTDHVTAPNHFTFFDGTDGGRSSSMLTQALGPRPDVRPSMRAERLAEGDIILVCSDGLTGFVAESQIRSILTSFGPQQAAETLLALANDAGGVDNISVIVGRVVHLSTTPETPIVVRAPFQHIQAPFLRF